jgi:hypothetical protein
MNYSLPNYHSHFPGESYLNLHLPNYESERRIIIYKVIAAVFLFFFWLPNKYVFKTVAPTENKETFLLASSEEKSFKHLSNGVSKGKKQNRKKNSKVVSKSITADPPQNQREKQPQPQPTIEIDQLKSSLLTTFGILSVLLILFLSPNNLFPSRTLLTAPLFTRQECDRVISMAMEAARRNAQGAIKAKEELTLKFPELIEWEKDEFHGKKNATEFQAHEGWIQLTRLNSILKCEHSFWFVYSLRASQHTN